MKPPGALAQLRYAEAFDSDFSLLLKERDSATLADMQNDAIKVEVHMIAAKKSKMAKARLKEEEKPSTSSPEDKFETMMKTMEKLMDRWLLGITLLLQCSKNLNLGILSSEDLKIIKGQERTEINSQILQ